MSTATFKTAIKYKGQFYEANKPFLIENTDAAELEAMGANVELEQERQVPKGIVAEQSLDERNNYTFPIDTSALINSYLGMSVAKIKTSIEAVSDIVLLESLIEQDERASAKTIYRNRIEELKAAE